MCLHLFFFRGCLRLFTCSSNQAWIGDTKNLRGCVVIDLFGYEVCDLLDLPYKMWHNMVEVLFWHFLVLVNQGEDLLMERA